MNLKDQVIASVASLNLLSLPRDRCSLKKIWNLALVGWIFTKKMIISCLLSSPGISFRFLWFVEKSTATQLGEDCLHCMLGTHLFFCKLQNFSLFFLFLLSLHFFRTSVRYFQHFFCLRHEAGIPMCFFSFQIISHLTTMVDEMFLHMKKW